MRRPARLDGAGWGVAATVAVKVTAAVAATVATTGAAAAQQAGPAPAPPQAASPAPVSAPYFAAVWPVLSGERAKETVAYLDRFVRWPGNPGFDASIMHVAARLAAAGYVEESRATAEQRLTYRVERYPLANPAWTPVAATLRLLGRGPGAADRTRDNSPPVLDFATNRNMVATNSFPTPVDGVNAEVVRVATLTPAVLDSANVRGRIVMADAPVGRLFTEAVVRRGAIGVLAYSMPAYTQPEKNTRSIQFGSIPYDSSRKAWGIILSYDARRQLLDAFGEGPVRVSVRIETEFIAPATELAIVAEARGSARRDERFVYSAHVQEPGANDDASGVGTLTEMARTLAALMQSGRADPKRTITMLWGQEIRVTDRYLRQDTARLKGVRWGLSLDMTGEDTDKTGGTFLIEKMPDPSAIWTRGDDRHSEWGGRQIEEKDLRPHYFNDFLLARCLEQSRASGSEWVVKTNPFEGGSDHTAYLNNGKPGVLFWHFTDQFYHTDGDRIDKVSAATLRHVGVSALVSGLVLASADGAAARAIAAEVERAALRRLDVEVALGRESIAKGGDQALERRILEVWGKWYVDALVSATDIEVGGASPETTGAIGAAAARVDRKTRELIRSLTAE